MEYVLCVSAYEGGGDGVRVCVCVKCYVLVCMRVEGMGCLCVYVKERGGCVRGRESSRDSADGL